MNTVYYLICLEAQTLYSEKRLGAAEVFVEVMPEAVQPLIDKSGEGLNSIDQARFSGLSSDTAERAVLDWAHYHFPISTQDSYTWKIDPVSNPQLITSRVAPTAETNGCRLWVLKMHDFPKNAQPDAAANRCPARLKDEC